MGRMWDALRRGDGTMNEAKGSRTISAPVEDVGPMLAEPEEIPYIEVGPRKSMEASPSVLACSPDVAAPSRMLPAPENPPTAPRKAPFRSVFLAAADMQSETPQTDGTLHPIMTK